jgi:hypothetical protein
MRSFVAFLLHQNVTEVIKLMMKWAGHVARMGDIRNANKILIGKPNTTV